MEGLLKPETLALFLMFAVPGIIALYIRAQFLTGRLPAIAEGSIAYVILSLVYQGIVYPFARPLYASTDYNIWYWIGWFSILFVAPSILGLLLGLNIRKGWLKRLVNKLGFSTIHPIHSAWDWHFSKCEECWVIVVLKDGTKWYGWMGINSFMSSDSSERDIFIEEVYQMNEEGSPWGPRNSKVWIAQGEIQSLEFLSQ